MFYLRYATEVLLSSCGVSIYFFRFEPEKATNFSLQVSIALFPPTTGVYVRKRFTDCNDEGVIQNGFLIPVFLGSRFAIDIF